MITEAISIDSLSSIPSEDLQASGPYGHVYDLQLQLARAEDSLRYLRERLYDEIDRADRAAQARGGFGSLTSAWERVENDPEVKAAQARVTELNDLVLAAQSQVGGIVFLPAVESLPEIEKRLKALNRRSGKRGVEGQEITFQVTDERLMLHYCYAEDGSRGYHGDFEHVFAVFSGSTPKVPGFEFLATVIPTEHGNVVNKVPPIAYAMRHNASETGAEEALTSIDLTRYLHTGSICEHCNTIRNRKDCYVVYNEETGKTLQVGRTCLRDYTGINDPERIVKHLEQVWEFMRSVGGSRGSQPLLSTQEFMTHVAALIRASGGTYAQAKQSNYNGVGGAASDNHYNFTHDIRDKRGERMYVTPIEHDAQAAQRVIEWSRSGWTEEGDYPTKVKISLAGEWIERRELSNLAASAFAAYDRWTARESERKAQEEKNTVKGHVGTIGERIIMELKLTRIRWRPGYACNTDAPILIMEDATGNEIVWYASNLPAIGDQSSFHSPIEGGTYKVKATVKDHRDHERFGKSTIITRAKFEATISEPEEDGDA